jgi:hypothetical protein
VLNVQLFTAVTVKSHVNENDFPLGGVLHSACFFMLLHRISKVYV